MGLHQIKIKGNNYQSEENGRKSLPAIHLTVADSYPKYIKSSKNETTKEQIIQLTNGKVNNSQKKITYCQ
jgi:lipase chaperone LimK